MLPTRSLGKNGPQVSAVGFGLMGLSAWYGECPPDDERFAVLDRAYALGETFWDSADIYGDSEELVGKWFERTGKRDDIFLSTKFAFRWEPGQQPTVTGTAAYVREACEKSLKRLGVDHIDLYYYHRVDVSVPIEETIGAMAELVKEGKVKYLAMSSCGADTLRRAYAVHPIHALQVEYSPFSLEIERPDVGLLAACRELGVAIIAYCPLGRGMLTGAYKSSDAFAAGDMRSAVPLLMAENFATNFKLVEALTVLAKKHGATPGQLSLAWILAQGDDFIPIPGTKRIKYLEENLGSLKITLTPDEVKEIRNLCEAREIAGDLSPVGMGTPAFEDTPPFVRKLE